MQPYEHYTRHVLSMVNIYILNVMNWSWFRARRNVDVTPFMTKIYEFL